MIDNAFYFQRDRWRYFLSLCSDFYSIVCWWFTDYNNFPFLGIYKEKPIEWMSMAFTEQGNSRIAKDPLDFPCNNSFSCFAI